MSRLSAMLAPVKTSRTKDPRPTLAAYGAPLASFAPRREMPLEEAVVRALVSARRDASVALVLTLIIIGGAAIRLRYNKAHLTTDIDSVTSPGDRWLWAVIDRACRKMQEQAGLAEVPKVSSSGVFDPPEDWESRLRSLKRLKLTYLDVKLPERHDLAISKVSRGDPRDFEAIRAMHEEKPFP